MTTDQALAFIDVILSNPKAKAHLDSALGYGKTASMTDFGEDVTDPERLDRAQDLCEYIEQATGIAKHYVGSRPRQAEMDFQEEEAEAATA